MTCVHISQPGNTQDITYPLMFHNKGTHPLKYSVSCMGSGQASIMKHHHSPSFLKGYWGTAYTVVLIASRCVMASRRCYWAWHVHTPYTTLVCGHIYTHKDNVYTSRDEVGHSSPHKPLNSETMNNRRYLFQSIVHSLMELKHFIPRSVNIHDGLYYTSDMK